MSGQSWAVLVVVAVAAVYLGWQAWRLLRGFSAGRGCCESGCPSAATHGATPEGAATRPDADTPRFIPLENLTDLARRHREKLDRPGQAGS